MEVCKFIHIILTEEEVKSILDEITELEVKFDKEYIGSPYDEIENLQRLKLALCHKD